MFQAPQKNKIAKRTATTSFLLYVYVRRERSWFWYGDSKCPTNYLYHPASRPLSRLYAKKRGRSLRSCCRRRQREPAVNEFVWLCATGYRTIDEPRMKRFLSPPQRPSPCLATASCGSTHISVLLLEFVATRRQNYEPGRSQSRKTATGLNPFQRCAACNFFFVCMNFFCAGKVHRRLPKLVRCRTEKQRSHLQRACLNACSVELAVSCDVAHFIYFLYLPHTRKGTMW